jgi:hypothetical protein
MENHSIWETLDLKKDSPNVFRELKKQAESLADKTEGLLYAEVNPIDAYEEPTMDLGVVYNFYVYAPYLGNFRSMLFTVVEVRNKIYIIDRINRGEKREVSSIRDLITTMNEIISSTEVSKLISNLYASSLEVKKVDYKP